MSRPGNPYDNAKAESFMKTLKTEEVDGHSFKNIGHARRSIAAFIDIVYNSEFTPRSVTARQSNSKPTSR